MGFKISMTNPVSMHVFDGAEELFEEEFGMHLAVMSQFVDSIMTYALLSLWKLSL
jgi:hypothetical protein